MRNLKKVLALVIAFTMMLSVVAFAGFNDVAPDADYAGAVELLSALDIIVGDDLGNFNPDNTITRAEMAAIVCRIKGLEASANAAKGATKFDDVAADHWAAGYVNVANQNGVIAGYGDGKFGPEDQVTYEAAVKMIVSALGFEPMAAQKGGWPTGYLVVANTYKISEGVSGSTRADVATLVYNALSTPMMDQTIYGADAEFEILDGKKDRDYRTLLTDMDIYIATGIVEAEDKADDEIEFTVLEDSDDLEFEEDDEVRFEINGTNVADYMYQNVDVYVKRDKRNDYQVIAVVPGVYGETFALLSDDVVGYEAEKLEYYVDAANSSKTKTIKVDEDAKVVYNKGAAAKSIEDVIEIDDAQLMFIENTGDTTYDVVIAVEYYSAMVDEVNADRDRITIDNKGITFDFEDEDIAIEFCDSEGNELTLADFAEDDVVAILSDASAPDNFKNFKEYIKIIKLADSSVTGTVEETYTSNDDDYVVIDGEDYKVSATIEEDLAVGDEGIFYVGMTGKIIVFDGEAAGVNYAYIVEAAKSDSSFTDDKWQIKLLTKNDGVVTYDVTDDADDAFTKYATDAGWIDDDADTKDIKADEWLWEKHQDCKDDAARFITFKANSKGQIKSFEKAEGKVKALGEDDDYNEKTQKLGSSVLEDDVVLFIVEDDDADDVYATDLSYLVDETIYTGFVFENKDKEGVAAVITGGDGLFDLETGFAIVTKKSTSKDEDDNDIVKLSIAQNEEEATIVIDDDTKCVSDKDVEDINVGSVVLYNADSNGLVSKYAVIATVKSDIVTPTADAAEFCDDEDDEAYIAFGYIETRSKKGVLTIVTEDGKLELSDKTAQNRYTYNDAGRNVVIELGDYLTEDVDEAIDGEVSYVIVRVFEDDIVDIYSSNKRVKIEE